MTTVFQKNRLSAMTNGVVQDQFSACDEISTTSSAAVEASTHPPIEAVSVVKSESIEAVSVVRSQPIEEVSAVVKSEMPSVPDVIVEESAPRSEVDISINNVVCSFSLGCHLNLRNIASQGHNVEYRRESGMVTMKLRKPKITASIWSSGKITCTGAQTEEEARSGARRIARIIQKLGFRAKFRNMRIVNVLGTCFMPFQIRINAFSERFKEAEYEPELHPGVTYKIKHLKATLKIFSTGSITVTAPTVPNIGLAIEYIYPLVAEFQREFSSNKDDRLRKRAGCNEAFQQETCKRKRLNSNGNSCSSNDEVDKEVESIMSR